MILVNGKEQAAEDAAIPVTDRGLLLGDGIFTTLRIENGRPLLLRRHLERLEHAASVLGLVIGLSLLEQEALRAAAALKEPHGALRITVSRGTGPRGLAPPTDSKPVRIVAASAGGPRPSVPAPAIVSTHRRDEHSVLSRIKSLSYLDQVLAMMEAREAGAEDAVMLNTRGEPASTAMANLLAHDGSRWITPPASAGILPGVARAVLLELGAIEEAEVPPGRLGDFVLARSNSVIGVQPLALIGGAAPDPSLTARLTEALAEAESLAR